MIVPFPSQEKGYKFGLKKNFFFCKFLFIPTSGQTYRVESLPKPPVCPPYFDYTTLHFRVKCKLLAPVAFHVILGGGKHCHSNKTAGRILSSLIYSAAKGSLEDSIHQFPIRHLSTFLLVFFATVKSSALRWEEDFIHFSK